MQDDDDDARDVECTCKVLGEEYICNLGKRVDTMFKNVKPGDDRLKLILQPPLMRLVEENLGGRSSLGIIQKYVENHASQFDIMTIHNHLSEIGFIENDFTILLASLLKMNKGGHSSMGSIRNTLKTVTWDNKIGK